MECWGTLKLSYFIWRACVGALAKKERLQEQHILEDGTCVQCGCAQETIIHDIFHCFLMTPIWNNFPFSHYVQDALASSFLNYLCRSKLRWMVQISCCVWLWHGKLGHSGTQYLMVSRGATETLG